MNLLGLLFWVAALCVLLHFQDELKLLLKLSLVVLLATCREIGGASTLVGNLLFVLSGLLLVLVLAIIVVLSRLSILHVLNHLLLIHKWVHLT